VFCGRSSDGSGQAGPGGGEDQEQGGEEGGLEVDLPKFCNLHVATFVVLSGESLHWVRGRHCCPQFALLFIVCIAYWRVGGVVFHSIGIFL